MRRTNCWQRCAWLIRRCTTSYRRRRELISTSRGRRQRRRRPLLRDIPYPLATLQSADGAASRKPRTDMHVDGDGDPGVLAPPPPIAEYYDGESQRRGFVSRAFDAAAGDYE